MVRNDKSQVRAPGRHKQVGRLVLHFGLLPKRVSKSYHLPKRSLEVYFAFYQLTLINARICHTSGV